MGKLEAKGAHNTHISMEGEKVQLQFTPPSLDFNKCTFGTARSEKVLVQNTYRDKSIQLLSISGTSAHVHSSLFEDKVLPPLQNTSFHIVFVVRELGPFLSPLFIHTSEGTHKFMVEGIGVESPYRLQPIVVKRLPLNGVLKQQITIHNPHPVPITVLELVKNIEDLRLDLPSGRGQASQAMWKLPPYSTKTIMNAHFKASTINNFTGYIRMKTDQKDDILFIPVDITVSVNPGLYISEDKLDFGFGSSLQEPSTFTLEILNSARRVIKVSKIEAEPSSEAINVNFDPVKVSPNNTHPISIASITVDWKRACEEKLTSGKLVLRAKGGQVLLTVPYSLNPQEGTLGYDKYITTFWSGNEARNAMLVDFWVQNDYKTPLAISRVELQPLAPKQKNKALKLEPTVLSPGDKLTLMKLGKPSSVKGMAFLVVYTNITAINITLNSYDGKLHPIMLSLRPDEDLDLGLVGHGCMKEGFFALLNLNPLAIEITDWKITYSNANLELLGIDKEKFSTTNLLARTSFTDYDRSNIRVVEAGSYAVFRLRVQAPSHNENIVENIMVFTEYEDIKIPFRLNVLDGSLEMVKDSLVLPDCFPGKHCFATVQVQSTFPALMLVESVVSVPHSSDLRFYFPQLKQNIAKSIINPSTTSSIGHLLWGGKDAPEDLIYVEGYSDPANTPCMQLLGLPPRTKDIDLGVLQRNWDRFKKLTNNGKDQWKNYTFLMDTSGVRNFPFEVKVRLIWPRLTNITDQIVKFPLTQVGNTSYTTVEIINSASSALLLHIVLEDDYPGASELLSSLPPKLLPSCSDCPETAKGKKSFGIKSQGVTSSEESSLLKEAGVHPRTLLLLLGPLQSSRIFVTFTPTETGTSSSSLIIRNSLTVLEVLMLKGKAAKPQFRFGNRHPGTSIPFTFDIPENLLQECGRIRTPNPLSPPSDRSMNVKKSDATDDVELADSLEESLDEMQNMYPVPFMTVKRLITARNSGNLPITVSSISINGSPCEGNGFHIIDCQPFHLLPNEGRRIDIAHTPGFTFSRLRALLEFHTSMGFPVNFTLESFVPPEYLRPCYAAMPRPRWESFLLLSSTCVMTMLLFCVLIAAFLDTDRIMHSSFFTVANLAPILDLNLLDDSLFASKEETEEGEKVAKHHIIPEIIPGGADYLPASPPARLSSVVMALAQSPRPSQGSLQGSSQGSPPGTSQGSPQALSRGSSQGASPGSPQGSSQGPVGYSFGNSPFLRQSHPNHGPGPSQVHSSAAHFHQQLHHHGHGHGPLHSHTGPTHTHAHSHSHRGRSNNHSWLPWVKSFFFPIFKEKSKGRNSFIAAAQAAATQAAFSQAADDEAKEVSSLVNNAATIQRGGKKKCPKRDPPQEEYHGRRGRQQGKRRGGSQGGGGGSGGGGAGSGSGTGGGGGGDGGGNENKNAGTADGLGCPQHSRGAGSRRDRRNRKGGRCTCKPDGVSPLAADMPPVEDIEEEGEMSNFEDPVPADDPVNEFDPDPDISHRGKDILVCKDTIIETDGPKRFERESEGDKGKKTEFETKRDHPSQSHNQTSNAKGSRSGKKGKGNQIIDNHIASHTDQQNHSHKTRNQSKGHQNQGHELLSQDQQARHDQLGRHGHDLQGHKNQSNEQGRQSKGKDHQSKGQDHLQQNKSNDHTQHNKGQDYMHQMKGHDQSQHLKGQDQGKQNKGQDQGQQNKGQDQGQLNKGQDQGHQHKGNDQVQQNKGQDQGQQNKSNDSSQQNKGNDQGQQNKSDQSRSNQQGRRGQGGDQQPGNQRQGSKKSQGGNRTHDQSHVRIDSMTVRNRNAYRQGKNSGTSGTPVVENKRSSISDSGESCSLELPYRIKASDSSGKKSPIVSTVNYSSGFVDISQPSTISNNSQQEPPPAPPPPIKMWETSFSEVVARGEHTYSTVARMGSKANSASTSTSSSTLTVTTSTTSESVPEVCLPVNVDRVNIEHSAQATAPESVCPEFVPNGCTDSQNLALITFGMKDNVFKAPCSPHDGAHQSPEQKKELGPIGPRKKPAGQNTAIIAPWTENGASSLVPQPSSSPVVSSIFLRDGLREGLREPYDTYTAIPPPVMEALKEDQYARYSIENRSPSNMTSEYPLEQASSYENVYEQYHDPEGHYNGARTQQQQQQQQQIIGPFDSIRPPLYVGPSSYSMNRVVDHQLEHPMDLNGDLIHEPCDQRVEQGFDQSYDQSFAQPYDQQFDPAALKQQPSQQIMGGQQHQIDMLVQQFQQQSMQSLPQYPSVHQMQLQQQRQLPQTHLQQQQPPQQQPQQQPPPQQQQQPSQQPQQQQQMSMHMYQQQQLGPQGQAVVVIGGQRNIIGEAGIMPYMWLDQQSAQAAQVVQAAQAQQQMPQQQQSTLPHQMTQMSQQITHHLPQSNLPQHSPKPIQMPSQYSQHQFPQQPAVSPQTLAQQMQQYHLQQQQMQQSQQSQQQQLAPSQQMHQPSQVQQASQQHISQHHQQQVTQQQLHLIQEERNNLVDDEHQPPRFRAENWQRVSSPWDKSSSSGSNSTTTPLIGSRAAPGNAPGNVPSHGNTVGNSLGSALGTIGSSIGNSPGIVSGSTVGQPVAFKGNEGRSAGRDLGIESVPNTARNGSLWGAVGESWIGTADVGAAASGRPSAPPSSASSTSTIGTSSSNCLATTSSSIWSSESLLGISRPYTRERPATSQGTASQRQEENTFDPFRSRTISNIWSSKTSGK